jgi:hypothetical protein
MDDPQLTISHRDAMIKDPLSDPTRRVRKNLLGTSLVGLAMVYMNLFPSQISALGISFSTTDQRVLLLLIGSVTSYLLIGFTLYGFADFLRFRLAIVQTIHKGIIYHGNQLTARIKEEIQRLEGRKDLIVSSPPEQQAAAFDELRKEFQELREPNMRIRALEEELYARRGTRFAFAASKPAAVVRGIFEFAVPVAVGLWALLALIQKFRELLPPPASP